MSRCTSDDDMGVFSMGQQVSGQAGAADGGRRGGVGKEVMESSRPDHAATNLVTLIEVLPNYCEYLQGWIPVVAGQRSSVQLDAMVRI